MPHETLQPYEFELNLDAIHEELHFELHFEPNEDTRRICQLTEKSSPPFDDAACLERIHEAIDAYTQNQASVIKHSFAQSVLTGFPDGKTVEALETPSKYIARNNLSTSFRPQLREAQSKTIEQSKTNLTNTIQEDDSPYLLNATISDEELLDDIQTYKKMITDEVINAATNVKESVTGEQVKLSVLGILKVLEIGKTGAWIYKEGVGPKEIAAQKSAFLRLRQALNCYHNSEEKIAKLVSDKYHATIDDYLKDVLGQHYRAIVTDEIEILHYNLPRAYERASKRGRTNHMPVIEEDEDTLNIPKLMPSSEITNIIEEIDLGEVDSPFPWLKNAPIELTLMQNADTSLIYCTALPANAQTISERLRKKYPPNQKAFNRLWEQVKQIELSNATGTQDYINKVETLNNHYRDVAVLGFGNNAPNAKRVYYVKTTCARYPTIKEMTDIYEIDPSTTLIILVSETDKANQIKTFAGFGWNRAQARARNVGAI
jgi:hypothetical protein